eukprot:jgi/Chlat1/6617/Chrsp466S06085
MAAAAMETAALSGAVRGTWVGRSVGIAADEAKQRKKSISVGGKTKPPPQQRVPAVAVASSSGRGGSRRAATVSVATVKEGTRIPKDAAAAVAEVVALGRSTPAWSDQERAEAWRVAGCAARTWVRCSVDRATGGIDVRADSDSDIIRGVGTLLSKACQGRTPVEVASMSAPELLSLLGPLPPQVLSPSPRSGGARALADAILRQARAIRDGGDVGTRFPSLVIEADKLSPVGEFAEAQSRYLSPDPAQVQQLASLLASKRTGVVAHFYMGPEVQGVLSSAREVYPHIHVSDSLVMADSALRMVEEGGCQAICVLGVDFMAENVRAILDRAGHADIKVYRMSNDVIACSLADAARTNNYIKWLQHAKDNVSGPHLHVVYINTALDTKAHAHSIMPTITCTSSNVVQTILTAFKQIPNLHVWYGPDSYMGANIKDLLTRLASESGVEGEKYDLLGHDTTSLKSSLERYDYYKEGVCIVHDMFGEEVVKRVPGGMFSLAMEARARGMGVVGSTSNILDFITEKTKDALERDFDDKLTFVLGTESGMLTAIVRRVQSLLQQAKLSHPSSPSIQVEIVFPVNSDSITTTATTSPQLSFQGLSIIPGPAGGEGCSSEGGCASCPYMKMNTLEALIKVVERIGTPGEGMLSGYVPEVYGSVGEGGEGGSVADKGCEPIVHMRGFQKSGKLTEELVEDILARATP